MNTDTPNQVPSVPQLPAWETAIPVDVVHGIQYSPSETTETMSDFYFEIPAKLETPIISAETALDVAPTIELAAGDAEAPYQPQAVIAEARASIDAVDEIPVDTATPEANIFDTAPSQLPVPEVKEPDMQTFVMTRRKAVMLAAVSGMAVLLGHAEQSDMPHTTETVAASTSFAEMTSSAISEQMVPAADILRPQAEAPTLPANDAVTKQPSEAAESIFDQSTLAVESMSFELLPSEPGEYTDHNDVVDSSSETDMTGSRSYVDEPTGSSYNSVDSPDVENQFSEQLANQTHEPTDITFVPPDSEKQTTADKVKTFGLLLFGGLYAGLFLRTANRMPREPVAAIAGAAPAKTSVKVKVPASFTANTHRKPTTRRTRKVAPEIRYSSVTPSLLERLLPKRLHKTTQPATTPLSVYAVDVLRPVSNGQAGSIQPGFGGAPSYFAGQVFSSDDDQTA